MRKPPPLGDEHDVSRRCTRRVGLDADGEILCGQEAVAHIIFERHPQIIQGFVCLEHQAEFAERWTCDFVHPIDAECGMPGSVVLFPPENRCVAGDLPTAEPARMVAVLHVPSATLPGHALASTPES